MQTRKEEDLSALRRFVIIFKTFRILFHLHILLSSFLKSSPDAGVLELWCPDSKDTVLGSRNGWLAPPAGHSSTEMVPPGHRTGSNE